MRIGKVSNQGLVLTVFCTVCLLNLACPDHPRCEITPSSCCMWPRGRRAWPCSLGTRPGSRRKGMRVSGSRGTGAEGLTCNRGRKIDAKCVCCLWFSGLDCWQWVHQESIALRSCPALTSASTPALRSRSQELYALLCRYHCDGAGQGWDVRSGGPGSIGAAEENAGGLPVSQNSSTQS